MNHRLIASCSSAVLSSSGLSSVNHQEMPLHRAPIALSSLGGLVRGLLVGDAIRAGWYEAWCYLPRIPSWTSRSCGHRCCQSSAPLGLQPTNTSAALRHEARNLPFPSSLARPLWISSRRLVWSAPSSSLLCASRRTCPSRPAHWSGWLLGCVPLSQPLAFLSPYSADTWAPLRIGSIRLLLLHVSDVLPMLQ